MNPFKKEVIHRASAFDVERMIRKEYGRPEYELIADIESANDVSHSFTVQAKMDNHYKKKIEEFRKGGATGGPILWALLDDLCMRGKLEAGDYIVDVCW